MLKYIFSIIIIFLLYGATAQRARIPEIEEEVDFTPRDISVGYNLLRGGRTLFGDLKNTQEVQFSTTLYRYLFVVDYGLEETNRSTVNNGGLYTNTGSYVRVGLDRNFIKNISSGNVLSLGLRYANAEFEDQFSFTGNEDFEETLVQSSNPDLAARWFELTFNLRGKLVGNFYGGFTLRWQTFRKLSGEQTLAAFEIPGFGKTSRNNSTAFDYYLMYRIPFRD